MRNKKPLSMMFSVFFCFGWQGRSWQATQRKQCQCATTNQIKQCKKTPLMKQTKLNLPGQFHCQNLSCFYCNLWFLKSSSVLSITVLLDLALTDADVSLIPVPGEENFFDLPPPVQSFRGWSGTNQNSPFNRER